MSVDDRQIPVLVISLASATARRSAMRAQMARCGIDFAFFEAVDGRARREELIERFEPRPVLSDFGRPLSAGELGCIASYENVCRLVAEGDAPYVCVIEDDTLLDEDATAFLRPELLDTLPDFHVLRLGGQLGGTQRGVSLARVEKREVTAPIRANYGTQAQVISREGARRILDHIRPAYAPIDEMIYRDPSARLRILDVRPLPIGIAKGPSHIGVERLAESFGRRRDPWRVLQRGLYLMARKIQVVPCFVAAWGWNMLIRLRRYA